MPLKKYKGGIRAGRILEATEVEVRGAGGNGIGIHLRLEGSQSTLAPEWYAQNRPQVGQWFVTDLKSAWCVDEFDAEPE